MSNLTKIFICISCLLWISGSLFAWHAQITPVAPVEKVVQRPLSTLNWIATSDFYHRVGNAKHRDQALLAAEQTGHHRAAFMQAIMLRYLQWGNIGNAKRSARQLLALDASQAADTFVLLRPHISAKIFTEKVIPDHFLHPQHTRLTFFEKLMEGASQLEDGIMFYDIWLAMNDTERQQLSQSRYWFNYYSALVRNNGFAIIDTLSTLSSQQQISKDTPLSLAFDYSSAERPFCWIKQFHSEANVEINNDTLIVRLPAVNDKKRHQLNCYLPIVRLTPSKIIIHSEWSLHNSNKASAELRIRPIAAKSSKRRIIPLIQRKQGDWPNEDIKYEFIADHHTRGIEFSLNLPKPNITTDTQSSEFRIKPFTLEIIEVN